MVIEPPEAAALHLERIRPPNPERRLRPLRATCIRLLWHCDGNLLEVPPGIVHAGIRGFQGFREECRTRVAEVAGLRNRRGADFTADRRSVPPGQATMRRRVPPGAAYLTVTAAATSDGDQLRKA